MSFLRVVERFGVKKDVLWVPLYTLLRGFGNVALVILVGAMMPLAGLAKTLPANMGLVVLNHADEEVAPLANKNLVAQRFLFLVLDLVQAKTFWITELTLAVITFLGICSLTLFIQTIAQVTIAIATMSGAVRIRFFAAIAVK